MILYLININVHSFHFIVVADACICVDLLQDLPNNLKPNYFGDRLVSCLENMIDLREYYFLLFCGLEILTPVRFNTKMPWMDEILVIRTCRIGC